MLTSPLSTQYPGQSLPKSDRRLRAQVTASQRGKNSPKLPTKEDNQQNKPYQARSMGLVIRLPAQRLKRVFNIDITECEKGQRHNVNIIACIADVFVINKILTFSSIDLSQ